MPKEALPCVRCNRKLTNVQEDVDNQPHQGTAFTSYGHYGSTIWDPLDGVSFLEINICDNCLAQLRKEDKVFIGHEERKIITKYEVWRMYDERK